MAPLTDLRAHSLALTVQIRLALNRTDLAVKEVQSAKKWAQDSLLVNLAESWVGLRIVSFLGREVEGIVLTMYA